MKPNRFILGLAILSIFCAVQPALAALWAPSAQKIILISQINDNHQVIDAEGITYEISSPEVLKKAQTFKYQSVRILFTTMGDKFTISDLKATTEPAFDLPPNPPPKPAGSHLY